MNKIFFVRCRLQFLFGWFFASQLWHSSGYFSTTCGGDFEKTRNRNWVRFSFENGSEIGGHNLFFARCDVLRLSSGRRFLRRRDATLSSGNPSASRWSHHAVCLRGTYYSTSWKYRTTISHSFLWLETGLLEKSSLLEWLSSNLQGSGFSSQQARCCPV